MLCPISADIAQALEAPPIFLYILQGERCLEA